MDLFSYCNLVIYFINDQNEWQYEKKMEQVNKKWGDMSKDPGLGGALGGLCSILFPKKHDKKYMYQSFLPQSGISNKSIKHVVFYCYVHECSKRTYFHLSLKYILFFTFSPIYFSIMLFT